MVNIKKVSDYHVKSAIENGEFPAEVLNLSKNIAILMTQDWCPQWSSMDRMIHNISDDYDIDIYVIIYNQEKYYTEFLAFKENVLGNHLVPYVRYYNSGKLVGESNYTSEEAFLRNLGLK